MSQLPALKRQLDGWHTLWARTFNAVSEPLGNSLINRGWQTFPEIQDTKERLAAF